MEGGEIELKLERIFILIQVTFVLQNFIEE
jgi:hypothetical protein